MPYKAGNFTCNLDLMHLKMVKKSIIFADQIGFPFSNNEAASLTFFVCCGYASQLMVIFLMSIEYPQGHCKYTSPVPMICLMSTEYPEQLDRVSPLLVMLTSHCDSHFKCSVPASVKINWMVWI